jgi:hypothetical protein
MFLDNSRYYRQATVETTSSNGRTGLALKLRSLPVVTGSPHTVQEHDRLDILAQDQYDDATKFWHIADANTELEANGLVAEAGATLNLPET